MKVNKAVVLGCGPAGLMAAYAMDQCGYKVRILSRKIKSPIGGAQYLHNRILGLTPFDFDVEIDCVKIGSREGYAKKAYGDANVPKCSWDTFPSGIHQGWSLRTVYNQLWEKFSDRIEDTLVDVNLVNSISRNGYIIINSIPAHLICARPNTHLFIGRTDFLEKSELAPFYSNSIVYNGRDKDHWHRGSNIDGSTWLEFNSPGSDRIGIRKPETTTCDCHPGVIRVGRYGKWRRGILSDSAYWDIRDKFAREAT